MVIITTIIEILVIKETIAETKRSHLNKCKKTVIGLRKYFTQFWNLIAFISIIMSYAMIILWIMFISDPFLNEFLEDPESINQFDKLEGFSNLMIRYIAYRRICSLNWIFIALNMLEYLSYFPRINQFFQAVIAAKWQTIAYLVLIGGMFFAFCCYMFFMFAAKTPLLSSEWDVYIFCSHIMYGDLRDL